MAAEARMVSAEILSCRLWNALNSPESTSTAPTSNTGWDLSGCTPTFSKSTRRWSIPLNSSSATEEKGLEYGLSAGVARKSWRLLAHRSQLLTACSCGAVAELSRQKASSASAAPAASPSSRWCHASSAHTAPPEVPLKATTS